ncbi:MAG: FAD-dependent oxidoreductase [Firmicutes bacterium]|nr:FAD-dependent oxidoreductase [Bacillota bacterium]
MPKVQIWIDGKEIWAEEGSNLLEAALAAGIHIPHLCHDPRLKPFGSCRLCFVEIEGGRAPVPACGQVVTPGLKVTTENETIRKLRKTALSLLMTEHCGDCIAPCQLACPAHIDIQGYIAHIANGRRDAAAALIREQMPFASVCGRVCPRFCEDACRRNIVDEPVAICALKRYAGDFDLENFNSYAATPLPDTGKRVAVVGGGPAGLTAAYYLALAGHRVTVYDRGPELGGMLRYGIPEYRLPKAILDQEIKLITDLCAEVRLGQVLGKDFTLDELRQSYDAVFLGLGSQAAQMLGLPGEDSPGILNGIGFLRAVVEGNAPDLGRNVVVVGGGNTAMDAARTALRLGAEKVTVVYRRSREEMPANMQEIEEAEEEGVKFLLLANPQGYVCREGKLEELECIRMELGEPDASGRRRPVAIKGSEFTIPVDTVILAIGQTLEKETAATCGLELCDRGNLQADPQTGATCQEGVFAAGDCVTGPKTVVEAVGAAKRAALAIDQYLRGEPVVPAKEEFNCTMGENWEDIDPALFADREKLSRQSETILPAAERKADFREYNLGLTREAALRETKRCLSCGCQDAFDCELRRLCGAYDVDIKVLGTHEKRYDVVSGDYLVQDANKCILCGNCVRICQEVQDSGAMGFVNRGFETTVRQFQGPALSRSRLDAYGLCISACPTGALVAAQPFAKPGPFKAEKVVATTCTRCSMGCELEMHVSRDQIVAVTTPLRGGKNDGILCHKGYFAAHYVHGKERLTEPLLRDGGSLQPVSWDKAIGAAAAILEHVKKLQGAGGLAVLASPALTNEENYLLQKLAREVLETNNIAGTGAAESGVAFAAASFSDIAESDMILVTGADLTGDFPVLAAMVRKAAEGGGKLAIISEQPTMLDKYATHSLLVNTGCTEKVLTALYGLAGDQDLLAAGAKMPCRTEDMRRLLDELSRLLRVGIARLAAMLQDLSAAARPVVIVAGDSVGCREQELLAGLLAACGKKEKLLVMHAGGNTRGQLEMGVHPDLLPGRRPVSAVAAAPRHAGFTLPDLLVKISRGDIGAVLVAGDDLELTERVFGPETLVIAMATTWRKDLARADVVLPLATFAETDGTIVNSEGRLLPVRAALPPLTGRSNLAVMAALAAAMGKKFPATAAEVLAEAQSAWGVDLAAQDGKKEAAS